MRRYVKAIAVHPDDDDAVADVLSRRKGCLSVVFPVGYSGSDKAYIRKCGLGDKVTLWFVAGRIDVGGATLSSKHIYQAIQLLHRIDPSIKNMGIKGDFLGSVPVGHYLRYYKSSDQQEKLLRQDLVIFYHGTSTTLWEKIKNRGLLPRNISGLEPSHYRITGPVSQEDLVYLATGDSINTAFFAARDAARNHGGTPLVLLVYSGGIDPAKLLPDEDSKSEFWWQSANQMGTVAYAGKIYPKWLEPMYIMTNDGWDDILGDDLRAGD